MRAHARTLVPAVVLSAALALMIAGCSGDPAPNSANKAQSDTVTLVVHDSFGDAEAFSTAAGAATGYSVKVITAGDGGELTNKLVLTKGAPIADAFFGVDNSFASRLIEHGVVEPFAPKDLPESAEKYAIGPDPSAPASAEENGGSDASLALVPIDLGATCINIDTGWFTEHGVRPPKTYADLADPAYTGLTVLIDPTGSSTGAAFLTGTVAAFGDPGYEDYWKRLVKNGARIESGWSEAYNGQFTQGGGSGSFPIVLSYSTSPAWTLSDDGASSTTAALLDTCTSQIEYAGVLAGASNPDGAKAVIQYLLSNEFQSTIPDTMYMYPVDADVKLPEDWTRFAAMPSEPHDLSPAEIGAGLEGWLKGWSEAVGE